MLSFQLEFTEVEKLAERFNRAVDQRVIDGFIRDFLLDMAKKAIAKIKPRTPVNTGLLRNSWMIGNIEKVGNYYQVEIYTDIEYASFVENGFRAHWVPGTWQGRQFVYDRNAKTGMQVGKKGGWVEGKFMMKFSMKEIERELPPYLERRTNELLNRLLRGDG